MKPSPETLEKLTNTCTFCGATLKGEIQKEYGECARCLKENHYYLCESCGRPLERKSEIETNRCDQCHEANLQELETKQAGLAL